MKHNPRANESAERAADRDDGFHLCGVLQARQARVATQRVAHQTLAYYSTPFARV